MADRLRPLKSAFFLLLFTVAAFLIHGYHPAVEDANIYLTNVKKALHPELYPFNTQFFASHARLTLFPQFVKAVVEVTHLRLDWCMLLLQFAAIFVLLYATLRLARLVFQSPAAQWAGVAFITALLTIPVAGTALYLMDEYFNPRSVSMPLILLLMVDAYEKRRIRAALWVVLCAMIHPLMVVFGVAYVALSAIVAGISGNARITATAAALISLPFGIGAPVSEAYREVLKGNSYFFLQKWEWYEWLGAIGPLAILWWFRNIGRRQDRPWLARLSSDAFWFGVVFTIGAVIFTVPARFASLTLLQPMRAFQLVYLVFLILAAGLLAEYVLKNKAWRWLILFLPLCGGMYYKQRDIFSHSRHLELPGLAPHNDWVEAFDWIRQNTPTYAYFALPPRFMDADDAHSFRAIAERSQLADAIKDRSATTMFPANADLWIHQAHEQADWDRFQAADFERLKRDFGVDWVVLDARRQAELSCPYVNPTVAVCRLP